MLVTDLTISSLEYFDHDDQLVAQNFSSESFFGAESLSQASQNLASVVSQMVSASIISDLSEIADASFALKKLILNFAVVARKELSGLSNKDGALQATAVSQFQAI